MLSLQAFPAVLCCVPQTFATDLHLSMLLRECHCCCALQVGELSPRQLSNVLWMFGRMGSQPSQFIFLQLAAQMIVEQVCMPPDFAARCSGSMSSPAFGP